MDEKVNGRMYMKEREREWIRKWYDRESEWMREWMSEARMNEKVDDNVKDWVSEMTEIIANEWKTE